MNGGGKKGVERHRDPYYGFNKMYFKNLVMFKFKVTDTSFQKTLIPVHCHLFTV